jgi:hypothetical protein
MRKAYFLKRRMGNRYQHDQIDWVCAKSHDFHAVSEIMRYFSGQEIRAEIELRAFIFSKL